MEKQYSQLSLKERQQKFAQVVKDHELGLVDDSNSRFVSQMVKHMVELVKPFRKVCQKYKLGYSLEMQMFRPCTRFDEVVSVSSSQLVFDMFQRETYFREVELKFDWCDDQKVKEMLKEFVSERLTEKRVKVLELLDAVRKSDKQIDEVEELLKSL